MTWIKRGSARRPRKNARNFTQKSAQKRLDETLDSFHQKNENALFVNSRAAIVFKQTKIGLGRPCTCNKVEVLEEYEDAQIVDSNDLDERTGNASPSAPILAPQASPMDGVEIRVNNDNFFGDTGIAERADHLGDADQNGSVELDDLLPSENKLYTMDNMDREAIEGLDPAMQAIYEENIFSGATTNCGICFRTGFQPGFESPGHHYEVKTNYDIVDSMGYHVDVSAHPAQFQKQADDGYVDFEVLVPLFYTECLFSIRDNEQLLERVHVYEAGADPSIKKPISKAYFENYRGKHVRIRVYEKNFTHVSICFDLGMEPLHVNLSEEAQSLDFERDITSGNLTVILPARIGFLNSGDVIVIPDRNLVLKITEAPRKQLADRRLIEWSVSTRTLQTTEAMRSIHKGYKLK